VCARLDEKEKEKEKEKETHHLHEREVRNFNGNIKSSEKNLKEH
jgi:hypothetical protein